MAKTELDALLAFQQSELDAVYLYQHLARLMKNADDIALMLTLASDEGRHAGILKQYTNKTDLKSRRQLGDAVCAMYKILGKKAVFSLLSKAEIQSEAHYREYYESYPALAAIGADEMKHGNWLADRCR